jgi:hypothetical protein
MSTDNLRKKPEDTQWYPLYGFFSTKPYGYEATYDEILSVAGVNVRGNDRWMVYRVKKELLRSDNKCIDCVDNVGYRVVEPREHVKVAKDHRNRGRRQLEKASSVLTGTPTTMLSMKDRKDHAEAELVISRQLQAVRKRTPRGLDKLLKEQPKTTDSTKANAEAARSRLEQLRFVSSDRVSAD